MAPRHPARARALATVTRCACWPRATRGRERVPSRPGAFPRLSGLIVGGVSRRRWSWRLPWAGERYAQAPAPRALRAWVCPAWVMAPGGRRAPEASSAGTQPTHGLRSRGLAKRGRSPRSATRVTATVHGTPRRACRAATTAGTRQAGTCACSAGASRGRRAGWACTARTYACQTMWCAGGGQPTAASPRRGAGLPWARPGSRRAWLSQQAVRRHWAALRARRVSSRTRVRARRASSATVGPETAVRAPERARRASGLASRRSVLIRSPAFGGRREGAPTQPSSAVCLRDR